MTPKVKKALIISGICLAIYIIGAVLYLVISINIREKNAIIERNTEFYLKTKYVSEDFLKENIYLDKYIIDKYDKKRVDIEYYTDNQNITIVDKDQTSYELKINFTDTIQKFNLYATFKYKNKTGTNSYQFTVCTKGQHDLYSKLPRNVILKNDGTLEINEEFSFGENSNKTKGAYVYTIDLNNNTLKCHYVEKVYNYSTLIDQTHYYVTYDAVKQTISDDAYTIYTNINNNDASNYENLNNTAVLGLFEYIKILDEYYIDKNIQYVTYLGLNNIDDYNLKSLIDVNYTLNLFEEIENAPEEMVYKFIAPSDGTYIIFSEYDAPSYYRDATINILDSDKTKIDTLSVSINNDYSIELKKNDVIYLEIEYKDKSHKLSLIIYDGSLGAEFGLEVCNLEDKLCELDTVQQELKIQEKVFLYEFNHNNSMNIQIYLEYYALKSGGIAYTIFSEDREVIQMSKYIFEVEDKKEIYTIDLSNIPEGKHYIVIIIDCSKKYDFSYPKGNIYIE